jgi:crossover junction endodeoxyribonuclease RusA
MKKTRVRRPIMMFEFLIPKRPLSLQAKSPSLRAWKGFVRAEAAKSWNGPEIQTGDLQLTLVYLCGISPPDTDNIVKPIQDALVGLVFSDDGLIADVESHRRPLHGTFDLTQLPQLVLKGIASGQECVYVQVSNSRPLEEYL